MGRPKQIRIPDFGGEISLRNVTPEMIRDLVLGSKSTPADVTEAPEEAPVVDSILNKTALGTYQDANGLWNVALVKFNATTGQAKVEEVIKAGYEKGEAEERFKILTIQKGVLS